MSDDEQNEIAQEGDSSSQSPEGNEGCIRTKKRRSGSRGRRGHKAEASLEQQAETEAPSPVPPVAEKPVQAAPEPVREQRAPALPQTPLPPAPKVLVLRKSSSHPGERMIESRALENTPAALAAAAPMERHQRGIRAQGASLEHWWSKRWMTFVEQFHAGQSLTKGRNDARFGAVVKIQIDVGSVTATVQGALGETYEVGIGLDPIDDDAWDRILERLLDEPIFAARLLAGELPEEIEAVFDEEDCTLFPRQPSDLVTFCSCPDGDHFCQHMAAVYYLLGEEFERDPFLIFRLRGRDRNDLMEALQDDLPPEEGDEEPPIARNGANALPWDPRVFWGYSLPALPPDSEEDWKLPKNLAAGLARRLGNFPFWRGSEAFLDTMDGIYATASITTLDTLLRERVPPDPEELARRLAQDRPRQPMFKRHGHPPVRRIAERREEDRTDDQRDEKPAKTVRKVIAGRSQMNQPPRLYRSRKHTTRPTRHD